MKPEVWQDEKVGSVSRDARLLFIGLITMADDAGRFRALPSVILGHAFPYDEDAGRKIKRWLNELLEEGLIDLYEIAGKHYGRIPKWEKHQKINRPNPSILPEPSMNGHGAITEGSVNGR